MAFRKFHIGVVTRTALLAGTCMVLVYVAAVARLEFTTALVTAILALQVWNLIRYVEKSNRDVSRFLDSVRQDDFSLSYPDDGRGGSHRELRRVLTDVLSDFRRIRAEREANYRFLNTIVTHVETGLIGVDDDGTIELINPAARHLLDIDTARHLEDLPGESKPVAKEIERLKPGERSLVQLDRDGKTTHISLAATEFKAEGRAVKLVSLLDIGRELGERELETWRQLGRVLSHEIINSVAPIASLATTTRETLNSVEPAKVTDGSYSVDAETFNDLEEVIETIAQRSQGLVRFVEEYRRLTRLPTPSYQVIRLSDLLSRVRQLLLARPEAGSVHIDCDVDPEPLELTADPDLLEQALINVGVNAVQALEGREDGVVGLSACLGDRGRILISVTDNGPGISETALGSVFLPFFTTKTGGTGIGLSLARQIMRLHGGDISVTSSPNERTAFTLHF